MRRLRRGMRDRRRRVKEIRKTARFTVVPVAGDGGMGEEEVVEVGVLLDCRNISSSKLD